MRLWIGYIASAVCAVLLSGVSAAAAERIALVIGNSDYERSGWELPNAVKDARLVATSLRAVGFDVELVLNADEQTMENAYEQLSRRLRAAGTDSVGLFFFAGHGVQSGGLNYLIPTDSQAEVVQEIWAEALRLGEITDALKFAGNATNFIILDACRDNPLPSASRSAGGGGLARAPASARGSFIAYATAPGSTAADGVGTNSPYSAALAELIGTPGWSAEELFRQVAGHVEAMTNNAQQPWYESGLRGESFCFAGCDVSNAPRPPTRSVDQVVFDLAQTPCDYAAFVVDYPTSPLATLARSRAAGCEPKHEDLSLASIAGSWSGVYRCTLGLSGAGQTEYKFNVENGLPVSARETFNRGLLKGYTDYEVTAVAEREREFSMYTDDYYGGYSLNLALSEDGQSLRGTYDGHPTCNSVLLQR